jgi:hypothetical protein
MVDKDRIQGSAEIFTPRPPPWAGFPLSAPLTAIPKTPILRRKVVSAHQGRFARGAAPSSAPH